MCGIIAAASNRNVGKLLVQGLHKMEYRGYDSAGIALHQNDGIAHLRTLGKVQLLEEKMIAEKPKSKLGIAHTSRTFRFLADPRFPDGIDDSDAGCFSILNDPGVDPITAENIGAPQAISDFQSVLGYTRFNPERNFHRPSDATEVLNENGVVYFPGASAIYKAGGIVGGLGVSGDGVDQDDVVTLAAIRGFEPPSNLTADTLRLDGVRLPYLKFLRNPLG